MLKLSARKWWTSVRPCPAVWNGSDVNASDVDGLDIAPAPAPGPEDAPPVPFGEPDRQSLRPVHFSAQLEYFFVG
jgi:hypothetical protein